MREIKSKFEIDLMESSINFLEQKSYTLLEEVKKIINDQCLSSTSKCNNIIEALNKYQDTK